MRTPDHTKRDAETVREMFARIAPRYDKINRAMCLGLDRRWRRKLADMARKTSGQSPVLDLACGSGDIALEILRKSPDTKLVACDLCPQMLDIAKEKIDSEGLEAQTVCANAENLPFQDSSFGACTIGFGFRNFADRKKSLSEIARVLKKDGGLFILEVARAPLCFEPVQNFFMGRVVPNMAAVFGGSKEDYRYLAKTTREFPRRKELKALICDAGFHNVSTKRFAFGFVAITKALKK